MGKNKNKEYKNKAAWFIVNKASTTTTSTSTSKIMMMMKIAVTVGINLRRDEQREDPFPQMILFVMCPCLNQMQTY